MSYIIGIDLGTTHTSLAYMPLEGGAVTQEEILQKVALDQEEERPLLPSCLYFPLPEEGEGYTIGYYARERGKEINDRLIQSSKSWLCQSGIDRKASILPFKSDYEPKISPFECARAILEHLKRTWDQKHPKTLFKEQKVLITVPASFDPEARELVQEAAQAAGYPEIILLEEPLSAFYAWLSKHEESWRKLLTVGDVVLVVDIGGGTTDFTLIEVQEENKELTLKRLAVGQHLLLGGDNIDWTLAFQGQQKLGKELSDWQMMALVHSARRVKEEIFSKKPKSSYDLVIPGRGTKLVGGSLKCSIDQKEAEELILEGFFPFVDPSQASQPEKKTGLKDLGLNYVKDPRVTAQLAKFLSMTGETGQIELSRFIMPTHVLFNGGTLHAAAFQERLKDQLNQWADFFKKPSVKMLEGGNLDFAVSTGAAWYGYVRQGHAIRIKSGVSRSYFIGVEDSMPAVPGMKPPVTCVCIVPYGMEEGSEEELKSKQFQLTVGDQATFRFFSRGAPTLSSGDTPVMGTSVKKWQNELSELSPVETLLKSEGSRESVSVHLKSKITELGVLELWAHAADGRQWKLEFDIRTSE